MKYHSHTSKSYKGLDKHLSTKHKLKDYYCQYIRPPNTRVYIRGKPTQFLNLRKCYQNHCYAKDIKIDSNT